MTDLDKLLKQHFDAEDKPSLDAQIDQWLAEDLTAEYDRIVAQQEAAAGSRPVRKRLARWLTAAAAIALLIGVGVWLWPKEKTTSQQQMAKVVEKKTLHQTTLTQTTLALPPSMKGEAPPPAPPCMEGSNYSFGKLKPSKKHITPLPSGRGRGWVSFFYHIQSNHENSLKIILCLHGMLRPGRNIHGL